MLKTEMVKRQTKKEKQGTDVYYGNSCNWKKPNQLPWLTSQQWMHRLTYLDRQWTKLDGQWANSKYSNLDQPVNNGWTVEKSGPTVDKAGRTVGKPKTFKP